MPQLVVKGPNLRVIALSGKETVTLGRSPDNAVVLDDPEVSRHHCRIVPLGGGHKIVDLGSSNGTFLNGRCVDSLVLEFTDQITVGQHMLIYLDDDVDPAKIKPLGGVTQLPWPEVEAESDLLLSSNETTRLALPHLGAGTTRLFLRHEERQDMRRQEILLRIGLLGHGVASHFEMCRLMDAILDELVCFTGHERGLLLLYDEATSQLQPVAGRDKARSPLATDEWVFDRDVVDQALTPYSPGEEQGAALCLPLLANSRLSLHERRMGRPQQRCLGAIYLDGGSAWAPQCDEDTWLVEALASHAASALRNARLHHIATTDVLTRLHNRTFMLQVLHEELLHETQLAVLMVDLDHFKRINDTYGHGAGDEVLARAAQRIQRTLRCDDYVGRWGGEEFLVLLPGVDQEGAMEVAAKIGRAIASKPVGEHRIQLTASIGMALRPLHGEDAELLVHRADLALYAAKEAGRSQQQVYRSELDAGLTPLGTSRAG